MGVGMNVRGRVRRFVVVLGLAGAAAGLVGFSHLTQPYPQYQGGLAHASAVVKTRHPHFVGG